MAKNLYYGDGVTTLLLAIETNRIFDCSDSEDREVLHMIYGGTPYYESRSGLLDLDPSPDEDDLMELGWYCVDTDDEQKDQGIGDITVLVPWASGEGIMNEYPTVLYRQYGAFYQVLFTTIYMIKYYCRHWDEITFDKEILLPWFIPGTRGTQSVRAYLKMDTERDVDLSRFLIPNRAMNEASQQIDRDAEDGIPQSLFRAKLHIRGQDPWYHQSKYGHLDHIWTENPALIDGHIINGWCKIPNQPIWWRRFGNRISAFSEVPRYSLFPNFSIEGVQFSMVEYEDDFNILDWWSMSVSELWAHFHRRMEDKARKDWANHQRKKMSQENLIQNLKNQMAKTPDRIITVNDSVKVGNCREGTITWAKRRGLNFMKGESMQSLLEYPDIDTLLLKPDFREVIKSRLSSS